MPLGAVMQELLLSAAKTVVAMEAPSVPAAQCPHLTHLSKSRDACWDDSNWGLQLSQAGRAETMPFVGNHARDWMCSSKTTLALVCELAYTVVPGL